MEEPADHSSERERREREARPPRKKGRKLHRITIDRTETLDVHRPLGHTEGEVHPRRRGQEAVDDLLDAIVCLLLADFGFDASTHPDDSTPRREPELLDSGLRRSRKYLLKRSTHGPARTSVTFEMWSRLT